MGMPYTEDQVFLLESKSGQLAMLLASGIGSSEIRNIGYDTLEAIIYDAMLALREQMDEEDD